MHGLWGSIPYPFDKKLELNEKGLLSDLRHYIDVLGVEGFYMGGIINEFWTMTVDERKRAQELLIKEAAGAVRTITFTGHHCVKTVVELTKHAEAAGADFVAIMNPYYGAGSPEMIFEYFRAIAAQVEIGILILNSTTAKYLLSPAQVAKLAEIDNICGIKNDASFEHTNQIRKRVGDQIVVSDPNEENWLVNLFFYGQQVFLASPSPHLFQWKGHLPLKTYTQFAKDGKLEEAKKIAASMEPLRALARKWIWDPWASGNIPIARLKHWQELLGLTAGFVRPPLLEMSSEEKLKMREELMQAGLPSAV